MRGLARSTCTSTCTSTRPTHAPMAPNPYPSNPSPDNPTAYPRQQHIVQPISDLTLGARTPHSWTSPTARSHALTLTHTLTLKSPPLTLTPRPHIPTSCHPHASPPPPHPNPYSPTVLSRSKYAARPLRSLSRSCALLVSSIARLFDCARVAAADHERSAGRLVGNSPRPPRSMNDDATRRRHFLPMTTL